MGEGGGEREERESLGQLCEFHSVTTGGNVYLRVENHGFLRGETVVSGG